MNVIKPPRLRKGDLIGLVSPASTPLPREKIEKSVRYLEGLGFRATVGKHAASEHGYLAGTDAQRAADFNEMVRHREVRAIFALRGGYGSPRILNLLDYRALRRAPKIISGFSDITALQLAVFRKTGLVTFSGPMPAVELWQNPDPYTEANFWRLLTSARRPAPLRNPPDDPVQVWQRGGAQGPLLGGNLTLAAATVGTPFFPNTRGAVWVFEEVDEAPYRVDRLLTQLRNSGRFASAAGIVFGKFTRCEEKDPRKRTFTLEQVLRDFADQLAIPTLAGFAYGHVPKKLTVPLGVQARLAFGKGAGIELLEPAVD